MSLAVKMTGISKRFGEVQALDSVDLSVESGTLHALVGENGAGKSTLMKVLYGALQPDSGEVQVEGQRVDIKSSAQAIALGIGMVSQHYGIIPELSCLQNLILGAEGGPVIQLAAARDRAQELAAKMGFSFDWDSDAADLTPAGAQKLEILKLLWRNSRIMILDEPTAMLSPLDGEALFASLRQLVDGGSTVILVTHRLPEVFDYCQEVTVLRGGKLVATKSVTSTNPAELAELIIGKRLEPAESHAETPGDVIFEASELSVKGYRGDLALKSINLKIRSGEVVGIAGVDGSGQRELLHAIAGTVGFVGGSAKLFGRDLTEISAQQRLDAGLRIIPEDRLGEGVIEEWSLVENCALGLQRQFPFSRSGIVLEGDRRTAAGVIADRFQTKRGSLDEPIASLSGGNQQRFVAGRALFGKPRLILAFQPARGLDLAATREVYEAIREKCREGAAALVVSYDLDELLDYCDRIVVLNRGVLSEPGAGNERNPEVIGRLMVGAE
ncbi:MAG TPA: ABC transporter ATP-binding protein [Fimbriimonadaceae bacterium]|nr:ABC transporter ATP-binding protein [Fimbriimonadaceae bacterium]